MFRAMTVLPTAFALAQSVSVAASTGAVLSDGRLPGSSGFLDSTIHPSRGGESICVSGVVPVHAATTENLKSNFSLPANQSQVTEAIIDFVVSGGQPFLDSMKVNTQAVNGTYNISTTLCLPANDTVPTTVQLLTHGVGFEGSYWDFAPGYSYVDAAIGAGYAAVYYDRLGVGASSKEDPLDVIQAPLELEIANQLVSKLRNGTIGDIAFPKVVGVGHSFGSVITEALTTANPDALDAAILTGYSINSTGSPIFFNALNLAIASDSQPYRFAGLNTAYLVASTAISMQIGFFSAPGFDPSILSLADATKGSLTLGELFSPTAITGRPTNFTGPLAVVNGEKDLPFCHANCSSPTNLAAEVKVLYPHVQEQRFDTYLAPNTGHALNLHYAAEDAFAWIQGFLNKQGL